ncbi:MAG: hypothetical protein GWN00_09170, partial [Aliifodinibius sp.]|nr:nucleotidyltransferase domain-containing protein [Fodinibius sp.]NIY24966.1 hypothetical protein [Fodinibius sp.]
MATFKHCLSISGLDKDLREDLQEEIRKNVKKGAKAPEYAIKQRLKELGQEINGVMGTIDSQYRQDVPMAKYATPSGTSPAYRTTGGSVFSGKDYKQAFAKMSKSKVMRDRAAQAGPALFDIGYVTKDGEFHSVETVEQQLFPAKYALPNETWIKEQFSALNPFEDEGIYADDIKAVYIVGSEALGKAKSTSDVDVAIVIPSIKGKTALKISEEFHQKFGRNLPIWNNRDVDFQFFYEGDPELAEYT